MKIELTSDTAVIDLKHAFVEAFPGLKLELFKKSHDESESSNAKMRVKGVEQVADLVSCDLPCSIEVDRNMSVSEVEQKFEQEAGLHVQVFRKMRGVWIETVQTDHYTLGEQMDLASSSISA